MRVRFAAVIFAIIFAFSLIAQQPVTLNDAQYPALFVKTNQPGYYIVAPTVRTNIALTIRGVVARGVVKQHFENTSDHCVEAVYVFPLSENAAVDAMRLRVGDRVIDGEIHEKAQAQQVYEQAKSEGKRASLLEQHRPNLFTASVASVAPRQAIDVEIEFQEIVQYDSGHFSLRLPLAVAPRYTPHGDSSAPLPAMKYASPDANANPVELTIDLDAGVELENVTSPTHSLQYNPGATKYNALNVQLGADRDFELVWTPRLGTTPQRAIFSEGATR